jgi:hypothetical protein
MEEKREIWMYVTRGWTKPEKRKYVLGECPVVERIAEVCAHHERAVFHFPLFSK